MGQCGIKAYFKSLPAIVNIITHHDYYGGHYHTRVKKEKTASSMSNEKITALINEMSKASFFEAEAFEAQVVAYGEEALTCLLQALPDAERQIQISIIKLMRHFKDDRITHALASLVISDDILVAQTAIKTVAAQNTTNAMQTLVNGVLLARDTVAIYIINVLGKSGYQPAIAPLSELLDRTESDTIRYTIIEALGILGATNARTRIARYANHPNHHVRSRANTALEKLAEQTR